MYTEQGRHGGCGLVPGYHTDMTGLTADEARALFIFAGRGTLADLGLDKDLQAALRKLLAGLPALQRPTALQAQERVIVDPRGWMRSGEAAPHLPTVQEAVWRERRLRMAYRSSGASAAHERLVDPYGLVAKGGVWYLIAAIGGEPRLYRVSRIDGATLCDEPVVRPPGLDLEALWERLRQRVEERGAGVEVTVRVCPERLDMLLRLCATQVVAPTERDSQPDSSGWAVLRLRFPAEEAAAGLLLGFGADVEMLAPASLRRRCAEIAGALVALYTRLPV